MSEDCVSLDVIIHFLVRRLSIERISSLWVVAQLLLEYLF